MKIRIVIVILLVAAFLIPSQSQAFDNLRKGFVLGLGAGYGSATISDSSSESWSGLATTFKIGGGTSEHLMIYYSNRVIFLSENSFNWYQGMSAAGVSYFFTPESPSLYLSGELGLGTWNSFESGISGESGVGFTVGIGFEMSRHLVVEANYMRSSIGDDDDLNISNFTLALSWLGY